MTPEKMGREDGPETLDLADPDVEIPHEPADEGTVDLRMVEGMVEGASINLGSNDGRDAG